MSDPTSLGSASAEHCAVVTRVTEREALEARLIAGTTTKADVARLVESLEALTEENRVLRERLGCAVEELERRHPLDADPLTAAIIRDSRAALGSA